MKSNIGDDHEPTREAAESNVQISSSKETLERPVSCPFNSSFHSFSDDCPSPLMPCQGNP